MDVKIYIRDISTLYDLRYALGFCAEQLSNVADDVNGYLDGVLRVLESQKETLGQRLEEARERVYEAEEALSACEASQEWDEERRRYVPSCSGEASRVRSARAEESECAAAYAEAEHIYSECKTEIDKYHEKGGFFSPPGGEWTIRNLAEEKTEQAVKRLDEIIEQLKAILNASMGGTGAASSVELVQQVAENGPLTDREKKERFQKAAEKLNKEIKDGKGNIPQSNRVMKCPTCGRPSIVCTCGRNARERIVIYNNIDNSR